MRSFAPMITACPGCGRTTSTVFRELAAETEKYIRRRMPEWRRLDSRVADMSVAVMGCVVNGPGESKHANIGISLPGTGESPVAPVFIDGVKATTLRGETLTAQFLELLENYVKQRYALAPVAREE